MDDFECVCVIHETKGPLICDRVERGAPRVRLALNDGFNRVVYHEFDRTDERDADGRPIYRHGE